MAVIKQGGQTGLQKVTEETLQQRLTRLGLPQTTNGASAQGLGATPDQAKMAGSAARKEVVLRQAADQSKNLMAAKEAQKTSGMLSEQEQSEIIAAERLTKLGGATAQIGELALQKLKGAGQGPVQRQVTQTGESELAKVINPVNNPAGYNAAKSALVSYANDPSQLESALVTLRNLGIQDPETYLEKADQVLNRAVQTSGLTVAEMANILPSYGFTGGVSELATTLGLTTDQLSSMSPTDLSNQINAKRQELLDRTTQLQSQAGRTGLAGAAGQQQLQAFTQAGGVAREKEAARPTVDMAAKVKVGDTEYDVENILKDEEFSEVIEQWLAAKPEDRAKIIPGDWPLSEWLTSNESSLAAATQAGAAAGLQLSEAQKRISNLNDYSNEILSTFVPGYEKGKVYSKADLDAMKSAWESSGLAGLDMSFLNKLKSDEVTMIKNGAVSRPDLEFMANELPGLLSGAVGKAMPDLGLTPGKSFYSPEDLQKIKAIKSISDADSSLLGSDWAKGLPLDTLTTLSKNPSLKREVMEIRQDQMTLDGSKNWTNDEYISNVFGSQQAVAALNDSYKQLSEAASYGDTEAKAALAKIKEMDTDKDGDVDLDDAKAMVGGHKIVDINKYMTDYDQSKSDYTPFKSTMGDKVTDSLAYKPGAEKQAAMDILRGKMKLDFSNLGILETYMKQMPGDTNLLRQARSLIDGLVTQEANSTSNAYRAFYMAGNDILNGNLKVPSVDAINSKIAELEATINGAHPYIKDKLRNTLSDLRESKTKVEGVTSAAKVTGIDLGKLGKKAGSYMRYMDSYNTKLFGKGWWNNDEYRRAAAGTPGRKDLPIYPWEAPRMRYIGDVQPPYYTYNRNGRELSLSVKDYNNTMEAWKSLK